MGTIMGGILAMAIRIEEGGGDKDLNSYLTDNAGVELVDNDGVYVNCGKETE